jgi:ribosomal protein S18 acetylase RimI-like enzyme
MPSDQPQIRIVPALLEYVDSFRDCLDSVARERRWLMTLEAHPPEQVREHWASMIADGGVAFYAMDGEQVVGWIDIKPYCEEGIRHRGRLGMGVHRDYRGQSIGSRLMKDALAHARQSGLLRVDLTVYASNTAAIALYRKFGFAEEGRMIKGRYLDGQFEDVIYMGLIFQENLPRDAAK